MAEDYNNISVEELQKMSDALDTINAAVDEGAAKASITIDETSLMIEEAVPEDMPCKLCEYTSKFTSIGEIIDKFSSYAQYLKSMNLSFLNKVSKKIAQPIINKLSLLSLKIKKVTLQIKLSLAKLKRRILLLASQGKIAPVLQAIFGAIIVVIQTIFKVITAIINIINLIVQMIPFLFAVDAEGMSFFLTPRSLSTTKMNILNLNSSCERVLPSSVITAINKILDVPTYTMATNKKTAMTLSISKSAAAALNSNSDSGIVVVEADISYAVREALLSAINTMLALLPLVEPLPKYERLPMYKNLGFFLWLLTGWCPAGRKSFGLPGA